MDKFESTGFSEMNKEERLELLGNRIREAFMEACDSLVEGMSAGDTFHFEYNLEVFESHKGRN